MQFQIHPGILEHPAEEEMVEQLFGARVLLRKGRWIDRWEHRLLTACFQSCLLLLRLLYLSVASGFILEKERTSADLGSFSASRLEWKEKSSPIWLPPCAWPGGASSKLDFRDCCSFPHCTPAFKNALKHRTSKHHSLKVADTR